MASARHTGRRGLDLIGFAAAWPSMARAVARPPMALRRLRLVNCHTGETFDGAYRNDQGPIPRVIDEVCVFLRDHHSGEKTQIDVGVIDFLADVLRFVDPCHLGRPGMLRSRPSLMGKPPPDLGNSIARIAPLRPPLPVGATTWSPRALALDLPGPTMPTTRPSRNIGTRLMRCAISSRATSSISVSSPAVMPGAVMTSRRSPYRGVNTGHKLWVKCFPFRQQGEPPVKPGLAIDLIAADQVTLADHTKW